MGKTIDTSDIVGQRFGRIVVTSYHGKNKSGEHLYNVHCDCGNDKQILRKSLLSGKSRSCGCSHREPRINRLDIVGKKFGSLLVVDYHHHDSKTIWYKCKCDCGNVVIEQRSHLLNYPNITCGNCTKIIEEKEYCRYVCKSGESFIFDYEDLPAVKSHRWCIGDGYAECYIDKKLVKLHRLIMGAEENVLVDHINGDILDNRKSNLRIADRAGNARNAALCSTNTSGYKGVSWDKVRKKYLARIRQDGRMLNLGAYDKPEEAARAYDKAARFYYGEFACVNFPEPGEQGCKRKQEVKDEKIA